MTIKLRKQTIEILDVIKNKRSNVVATNLANEMKLDYIVLMSAVNEFIDNKLGGFEELKKFGQIIKPLLSSEQDRLYTYLSGEVEGEEMRYIFVHKNVEARKSFEDYSEKLNQDQI